MKRMFVSVFMIDLPSRQLSADRAGLFDLMFQLLDQETYSTQTLMRTEYRSKME